MDGFFHADPHPGNLLVDLDTGVLTFIDLGMMGELDLQKRLRLGQLMVVAHQGSVEGMADALRGMSTPFGGRVDEKAFRRDFARRMGRYMGARPRGLLRRGRQRGLRAAAPSTACVWTATSRWRSRRWCR